MIALAFLRSPLGKYGAIALAFVLAIWAVHHAGYRAGVKHEQAAYAKAAEKAQKRVAETEKASDAITTKAETKHVQTVEKIRWRTKTLKEEIKVYVPQVVDRGFVLPDGLVRVHDAAATGSSLPEIPGGSVETASDVAPSRLAETITDNYGTCHIWQSEALTWRTWYADQRDLWTKNYGAKR